MTGLISDAQQIRKMQDAPVRLWQLLALAWRYEMPTVMAANVLGENGMIVNLSQAKQLIGEVEQSTTPENLFLHVMCSSMEWQEQHNSPLLPMFEEETK